MGSKSDYPVMKEAEDILKEFNIDYEIEIVSAHRTPEKMMDYSCLLYTSPSPRD